MNNLFDVINYDISNFNIKVEFKYNQYNPEIEEDSTNNVYDRNILLKNDNINFDLVNKITINFEGFKRVNTFLERMSDDVISKLKSYQSKNLISTNEFFLFNTNSKLNDNMISFVSSNTKEFKRKTLKSLDIEISNYNNEDLTLKNVSYENEYLYDILLSKTKSRYNTDYNNLKFLSDYNNQTVEKLSPDSELFPRTFSISENMINQITARPSILNDVDDNNIINKLKNFYVSIVDESLNNLNNSTGVNFVGFLIKKYIKDKNNNFIDNAGVEFKYIDFYNNDNTELVLYDEFVLYGHSYAYEISPVFYLSLYDNNGVDNIFPYPLICHYLVVNDSIRSDFINAIEYLTPSPPNGLRVKFFSKSKQFQLEWDHPTNPQNDVVGFQIYRRKNLFEPFELIKVYLKRRPNDFKNILTFSDNNELGITNNLLEYSSDISLKNFYQFEVKDFDYLRDTFIYAVCSIDARGMISNYSTQIGIRYSTIYNDLIVDQVSMQNAPRAYPNLYVERKTKLFENDDMLFDFTPNFRNRKKITLFFTPDTLSVKDNLNTVNLDFENNKYQLNITRLNDLQTKKFKFKINKI